MVHELFRSSFWKWWLSLCRKQHPGQWMNWKGLAWSKKANGSQLCWWRPIMARRRVIFIVLFLRAPLYCSLRAMGQWQSLPANWLGRQGRVRSLGRCGDQIDRLSFSRCPPWRVRLFRGSSWRIHNEARGRPGEHGGVGTWWILWRMSWWYDGFWRDRWLWGLSQDVTEGCLGWKFSAFGPAFPVYRFYDKTIRRLPRAPYRFLYREVTKKMWWL